MGNTHINNVVMLLQPIGESPYTGNIYSEKTLKESVDKFKGIKITNSNGSWILGYIKKAEVKQNGLYVEIETINSPMSNERFLESIELHMEVIADFERDVNKKIVNKIQEVISVYCEAKMGIKCA